MLIQWLLASITVILTAYFVPGFIVSGFLGALIASLVIGLMNALVRPVLLFITFPINFLTLGLFTWIVNAATLRIAAAFTPGFAIQGWKAAIIGALVIALITTLIDVLLRQPRA